MIKAGWFQVPDGRERCVNIVDVVLLAVHSVADDLKKKRNLSASMRSERTAAVTTATVGVISFTFVSTFLNGSNTDGSEPLSEGDLIFAPFG